jgi:serine protease Do
MSHSSAAKLTNQMMISAATAAAVFAGFIAAPTLLSAPAQAQRIAPGPIAAPGGAPMSFADLIQRVSPAVVSINVRQKPSVNAQRPQAGEVPPGFEDFFRRFGEQGPRRGGVALGSGFFVSESGTIVTNHHVVEDAEEIEVRLSDGRELEAELIGSDQATDLAVLRVKTPGRYPHVVFDRSATVRVGDWVVAVGNPFGLDGTATAGIVSAKGRREGSNYVDFMQIDAPINRGNSGGPAFDLKGNVIGVNSAIFSPTGGNVGIGFAIPSETAARVVDQLVSSGRVTRGWLGVQVQAVDGAIAASLGLGDAKGAIVNGVTADSPASKAGVRQGDVILTFNGQPVQDSRDLTQKVGAANIGRDARVEIQRDGRKQVLNVRLGERPSERQLASADGSQVVPEEGEAATGKINSLGAAVRAMTEEDRRRFQLTGVDGGLVITRLDEESTLYERGVRQGDVLLNAGGRALRTPDDLETEIDAAKRQNRPILLRVQGRSGPSAFVAVEIK